MATCCVPLRSLSNYSLLTGTVPVDVLVRKAAGLGYGAIALTDRNGLYGAVPFFRAAAREGVRPILGVEVEHESGSALLLARNRQGLASICEVVTELHLAPRFRLETSLGRHARGMHVVVEEIELARVLRESYGTESLWLEATPRMGEEKRLRRRLAEGARLGLRPAATGEAYLLRPEDWPLHQVLVAVRERSMVGGVDARLLARPEQRLRSPGEMERLAAEIPEALSNSLRIAEECELGLLSDRPILPAAPVAAGRREEDLLRESCEEGLVRRYGSRDVSTEVRERMQRELAHITRSGFTGYFLIVGEIVRFARGAGIPVVGRGSGASSLLSYLLGVTSVDPIRHGLLFERFMNRLRPDCPDLDIDLSWERRDEVIEHVYRTYGRDRVAMISTHITYQPRSGFRDAARAMGVPLDTVNRLSSLIPRHAPDDSAEGLTVSHLTRALSSEIAPRRDPWRQILAATVSLQGFPRHLGIHCGGIVVGDRPLSQLVPLEEATKGFVVTQFEMRAIEAVGLVKIDLLGNRALSEVAETLRLVEEKAGTPPDLDHLPDHDPATADLLARGDTLGCFQIESPGMRNLLMQLHTGTEGDTICAHSLIRPGPAASGMKEEFIRCVREGPGARARPPHPELAAVLAGTRGIMLYEEDVIRVAAWMIGGDLAQGDEIRRAITGARGPELGEIGDYLIGRAMARGLTAEEAEEVWLSLRRFAAYSFCKAHAAGYGVLAYQTAYLKAHYPAAFAVSLMNHHQGMYPRRAFLSDARRHGVGVRPPCVNHSSRAWTLEEGEIRVGLTDVKGLSERVQDGLERERKRKPFTSLFDLLYRVPMTMPEAEALILVGALDFTGRSRPALVWELRTGRARSRGTALNVRRRAAPMTEDLFSATMTAAVGGAGACVRERGGAGSCAGSADGFAPPDFGPEDRLRYEWRFLGMWLTMHPTETKAARRAAGTARTGDLRRLAGKTVSLLGVPIARRGVRTKRGETMMFLTIEDAYGVAECTLFPAAYRRFRAAARSEELIRVTGKAEEQHGAVTLTTSSVEAFPLFQDDDETIRASAARGKTRGLHRHFAY